MESKSYSYRYNAWFGSIVSQAKLLSGQAGLLPELYYDFLSRVGDNSMNMQIVKLKFGK